MRTLPFVVCASLAGVSPAAGPAPAKFTKKPTARKVGDKVRIKFAVSRRTDVAVYIEDSKGKVVRHLAAGVLGKNPPEPLKANSLAQSIEWDGTDDDGEPLKGNYRLRVVAGMKVGYAGTAFSEKTGPNHIGGVLGLTTGPDGRLYVLSALGLWGHWGGTMLHVFRRDGAYEKTIKPFSSNLPLERLKAAGAFKDREGRLTPLIHHPHGMAFYPREEVRQQMAMTPDGLLLLAVVLARDERDYRRRGATPHLAIIDRDGGVPKGGYAGPALGKGLVYQGERAQGGARLAVSSDGKHAYIVNIGNRYYEKMFKFREHHVVYRAPLPAMGPASVFFGEKDKPGKDRAHLNEPMGVAIDGKGHLLVADRGNDRIVVLKEADASFAGSFPVEAPSWIGVHPKTGAVYVHSEKGGKPVHGDLRGVKDFIIKFSGWKDPRELSRMKLPPRGSPHRSFLWSFALDASAEPAVLWIGMSMGEGDWRGRGDHLRRCEDHGNNFTAPQKAGYYRSPRLWNLSVDPLRREVSCRSGGTYGNRLLVLNEATGEIQSPRPQLKGDHGGGWEFQLGLDGRICRLGVTSPLGQVDRDGKFIPFPATASVSDKTRRGYLANSPPGQSGWTRGLCVDRRGNIYVKTPGPWRIDVYSPDGNLKRTAVHRVTGRPVFGPRVDAAGNIYIADAVRPPGKLPYPEEFKDRLVDRSHRYWYTYLCGSIIKFGPKGGAVWPPSRDKRRKWQPGRPPADAAMDPSMKKENVTVWGQPAVLQGAEWWRFGFSPQSDRAGGPCHCTGTSFDVDDFGRVFYPDQVRFRAVVLDTNGNEILHFGSYGNQNHWGPDSYVPDPKGKFLRPRRKNDPKDLVSPFSEPEMALGWIVGIVVTDRHIYVADAVNRRVLRCRIGYAAEETCAIR